jgi:hypothetical protein
VSGNISAIGVGALIGERMVCQAGGSFPKFIFFPAARGILARRVIPRVKYIANTRIEFNPFLCNLLNCLWSVHCCMARGSFHKRKLRAGRLHQHDFYVHHFDYFQGLQSNVAS